jgi:S1-C subfamily serine protease
VIKRILAGILVSLVVIVAIARHSSTSLPNIIGRVRTHVVLVETYNDFGRLGSGSGVILEGGIVLTARHVIDKVSRVVVVLDNGERVASDRFFVSQDLSHVDAGLIIIDSNKFNGHANLVPDSDVRIGERVFAVGSPFGRMNTVTVGRMSAVGRIVYGGCLSQIDIAGAPGSSGGPMFDSSGGVIGIVVRGSAYGMMYIVPSGICELIVDAYENVQKAQIK